MIIVIYIAIVALSCVQSASVKLYNKNNGSSAVFNFLKTVAALVIFVLMALKGFELHIPTVYYSVGFSLFLSVSMYCGYKALCLGPMSITSLLVSFSLVIPSIYGIAFCDEEMTFVKVIGFVLLFTALVLFNIKKTEEDRKTSGKWLFYVAMTFLTNGGCSVIQKIVCCRNYFLDSSFEEKLFSKNFSHKRQTLRSFGRILKRCCEFPDTRACRI